MGVKKYEKKNGSKHFKIKKSMVINGKGFKKTKTFETIIHYHFSVVKKKQNVKVLW